MTILLLYTIYVRMIILITYIGNNDKIDSRNSSFFTNIIIIMLAIYNCKNFRVEKTT